MLSFLGLPEIISMFMSICLILQLQHLLCLEVQEIRVFTEIFPVSVFDTGQAFAICSRRCRCSSVIFPLMTILRSKEELSPSRCMLTVTVIPATGHCFRSAYILSVMAVHDASADSSNSSGVGPESAPPL